MRKLKKINVLNLIALICMSLFLGGCSLLNTIMYAEPEQEEFSFSGYVMADGEAVESAVVNCGPKSVETDENGFYSITGLTSAEIFVSLKIDISCIPRNCHQSI